VAVARALPMEGADLRVGQLGHKAMTGRMETGPGWEKRKRKIEPVTDFGQIDSWAEMDNRIGMAAEIDFEMIQGFLEFKSKHFQTEFELNSK
jgi:hypothetical protein